MGSQIQKSSEFDIQHYAPPLQQYQLKHSGPSYFVWNHIFQNYSLIQFPFSLKNASIKQQYFQMYLFRHRHHLIVSSHFFSYHKTTNKASIFFQRIFTNLSRIKDLPFKDSLQFYYVALKGFEILFRRFGYFQVDQAMFHITEAKKTKVWCDKDISKLKPEESICRKQGTEQEMVKKIIRIIEQNSDNSQADNFPIGSILYQSSSNFSSAIHRLRQVCQKQGFIIPDKLKCLDIISQGQFRTILDEYPESKQEKGRIQERDLHIEKEKENKQLVKQFERTNQRMSTSPLQSKTKKQKGLIISQSLDKIGRKSLHVENANYLNCQLRSQQKNKRTQQVVVRQIPYPKPMVTFVSQAPHAKHYEVHRGNIIPRMNQITQPTYRLVKKEATGFPYQPKLVYPFPVTANQRRNPIRDLNQRNFNVKEGIQIKIRPPSNPNPIQAPSYSPIYQVINIGKGESLCNNVEFSDSHRDKKRVETKQERKEKENSYTLHNIAVNKDIGKERKMDMDSPLKQTLIHGLKDLETKRENENMDEIMNVKSFKERFEQYKKNFPHQSPHSNQKSPLQDLSSNNYAPHQKLKPNAFFSGILQTQTVSSFIDSNGFLQQKRNEWEKIKSPPQNNDVVTEQIPSVTDISDNISYFPFKQKHEEQDNKKHQKENINVFLDRTNKKYKPDIDKEIWADMLKARNKHKIEPPHH